MVENDMGTLMFNNESIQLYPPLEKGVVCVKEEIITNNAHQIVTSELFSQLIIRLFVWFNVFITYYCVRLIITPTIDIHIKQRVYKSIEIMLIIIMQLQFVLLTLIVFQNPLAIIGHIIFWFITYIVLLYKFVMILYPVIATIIKRLKDGKK